MSAKFGDSVFVHYLIAFHSRPEAVSDLISFRFYGLTVPDTRMKFRDPSVNCSRKVPPEAVEGAIFDSFSRESESLSLSPEHIISL